MSNLTELEARLIGEVSQETLWHHASTLAQWERISGTAGERAGVDYLQQQLKNYGLKTDLYEFESLLGWPEEAALEVRSPVAKTLKAITHSFVPSTPPEGIEAEVVHVGAASEADFARQPVAGKIVLLDGMSSPTKVLRCQQHGVAAAIFVTADRLHDMCVSPVWGTATTKTADLLPKMPVVSTTRDSGNEIKAQMEKGPVTLWMRTKTFWDWRPTLVLTGEIPGVVEPDKFVLLSGHHCTWYYGAMDNGTANATMLEVARILSLHRQDLRRSVRVAFWPGHTQGRYSGSTWYFDNFWEDMHDNCVLHVNTDSTGARGAIHYVAISMPETRKFALSAIRDSIGAEAEPERQSRAGDQSFWGCGVPSIFMGLSEVPIEQAADLGGAGLFTAAGSEPKKKSGMPWFWHTPDDTIDKIDPEVLQRDTKVYLLATSRPAIEPVLPFHYAPAAREIRETLEQYQSAAGDRIDLSPATTRASKLEAAAETLDGLLDQARGGPLVEKAADLANKGAMAMDRVLVLLNFSGNGPFDQDLAIPIPAVPLLEQARRLRDMDPKSSESRFLVTELVRNRNKVAFHLREALTAAEETINGLRSLLG